MVVLSWSLTKGVHMTTKVTDRLYAPVPLTNYQVFSDGTTSIPAVYNSARGCGTYKSIISNSIGKYKPGVFKVSDVDLYRSSGQLTPGVMRYHYPGSYGYGLEGPICYYGAVPPPKATWDQSKHNYTLSKAYSKTIAADAELGVFLGELRETLHMLKNPAGALVSFLSKNRTKGLRNAFHLTSDIWLQYRFGISPLIKDITDFISTFNRKAYLFDNKLRKKGANVKLKDQSRNVVHWDWFQNFNFDSIKETSTEIDCYSTIYYKIRCDKTVIERWGLSPGHAFNIAWELVPYSFVVDRFLAVGAWLDGFRRPEWIEYLGNSSSQKTAITENSRMVKLYTTYSGANPLYMSTPAAYSGTSATLLRRTNAALPALPAINPRPLDIVQDLDHLCLIWQRLKISRR